ncbi:MAG: twin-arginine translocation signal domain-containing protein [Planctomycetota bacterium]|nr:MAG: twin-arginine translocation signal domain-containing protein [Planctomycetota bacterium]
MSGLPISRRGFLGAAGAAALTTAVPARHEVHPRFPSPDQPIAISSLNGLRTVAKACELAAQGVRPVTAAIQGVAIVEADPNDISVGYGGLPNEEGVVQLDAACMDGPRHNAGAVACIERVMHPAQVAELVMDRTDHVLLVGEGATRFAHDHGFPDQDLLTPRAREIWLRWRASRSRDDDWLSPLGEETTNADFERLYGTIHCSVLNSDGDLGCCTTTSGLSFKIPGRVGDSPLIGCGLYCDNEVGSAGATGRGEAAILSGGSWLVVERMRAGDTPEEACLYVLRRVADQVQRQQAWQPGLWNEEKKRPAFNLSFYALRKDGLYGSARMLGLPGKPTFTVCDAAGAREEAGAIAFPD